MNKIIILLLALSFGFLSCNSEKKDDLQSIKSHVSRVEKIVSQFDSNVQSAIDNKNMNYIRLISKPVKDSCDMVLKQLETIDVSPNHEGVKKSAISYVSSMKQIVIAEEVYSTLTDSTAENIGNKIDLNLVLVSEKAKEDNVKYIKMLNELTAK